MEIVRDREAAADAAAADWLVAPMAGERGGRRQGPADRSNERGGGEAAALNRSSRPALFWFRGEKRLVKCCCGRPARTSAVVTLKPGQTWSTWPSLSRCQSVSQEVTQSWSTLLHGWALHDIT